MALTQVKKNAIADDAVTLAKQAAGTDGQIITYDASGNPTAVGPGTDGQVLTSTGAGSPPAFEDAAGGPSLANDANNRVITGTGSGLNGEANLTFDGNNLAQTIDAAGEGIKLTASGNHWMAVEGDANRNNTTGGILAVSGKWNGTQVGLMEIQTGQDTTNKDDGQLNFYTTPSGGSLTSRMVIDPDGNVGIGTSPSHLTHIKKDTSGGAAGTKVVIENAATDSVNNNVELYLKTSAGDFGFKHYNATESYIQVPDQLIINTNTANSAAQALHIDTSQNVKVSNGNLVIGTSGKGIDFSATSDASGKDNELLDDYEEGTFTLTYKASSSDPTTSDVNANARYIKIGSLVWVNWHVYRVDIDNAGSGTARLGGLPFTVNANSPAPYGLLTHVNDKWPSSAEPHAVYGRTNTDLMQIIIYNGSQLAWNVATDYYFGGSFVYQST